MNNILLSIGIPTFNGGKFIGQAIESVLDQLDDTTFPLIEIIISDNASTDKTEEIVKCYVAKFPNLVIYNKNRENVGFDRNVDIVFKKSRGRYVKLLGDDDFFTPNSLQPVLKVLQEEKLYSVLLLNVSFIHTITNQKFGEYFIKEDLSFDDKDQFFLGSKWRTAAVSSLIINRDDWNNLDIERHYDNQWIHISAIIDILSKMPNSYVFSKESIIVRMGNERWSTQNGNQLKIGLKHLDVLSSMLQFGYDLKTYEYFLKERFSNNLKDIFFLAPFSIGERVQLVRLMFPFFKGYLSFWALHIPFLLLFSYPFQIAFSFLRNVNRAMKGLKTNNRLIKFYFI